jgi:manganese/zinc/iron transport system permease protein
MFEIFYLIGEHPGYIGWMVLMGFFVAASCSLVGNYLVLRRISLVGDAISHSVLPGIAVAFLISNSRDSIWMFLGALVAGIATTVFIQVIHSKTRVKEDAAIGITFSTLFALGVILISVFSGHIDLDLDCVLYGKLELVATGTSYAKVFGAEIAPRPVFVMGMVMLGCAALVVIFYKELLVSSFDEGLAASMGVNPQFVYYALMCVLSVVVVSAFEAVGAILVIAMLILPAATAYLVTDRLPWMIAWSILHAALSSLFGVQLAFAIEVPAAAAMVVAGMILFVLVWVFSPRHGLLRRWFGKVEVEEITTS